MVETAIAYSAFIIVALIVRDTILRRGRLALEEAKAAAMERDDAEFQAMRDEMEKWAQEIRNVRSGLSIKGLLK